MRTLKNSFNDVGTSFANKAFRVFQNVAGNLVNDFLKPIPGAHVMGTEGDVNNPENYFERDIDLSDPQADELMNNVNYFKSLLNGKRRRKRKIGKEPAFSLWNSFPISYSFEKDISSSTRQIVRDGIRIWEQNTCIRFRENGGGEDRLIFEDGNGCSSFIGRVGGVQPISIKTPGCNRVGIVTHEVGHALGFFHEQNRPDQSKYVQIKYTNINPLQYNNFLPQEWSDVNDYGVPYDFGSVMHYDSRGFAIFPFSYAIEAKDPYFQRTMGQRNGPSFVDFKQVNLAYCEDECRDRLGCLRGGYEDPNDCKRCRCPEGLGGVFCDTAQASSSGCGGVLTVTQDRQIISTPNYPGAFREGDECHWLLQAPQSNNVQLRFQGDFSFECSEPCSENYVELKKGGDFEVTGYRFCCGKRPSQTFRSVDDEMLVIFKAVEGSNRGFSAEVWSDAPASSGGSIRTATTARPLPPVNQRTTTPPPVTFAPAGPCDCDQWSAWSACDYDCGGCGYENRNRHCRSRDPDCYDGEKRRCNMLACGDSGFVFRKGRILFLNEGCCFGLLKNSANECLGLTTTIKEKISGFFNGFGKK